MAFRTNKVPAIEERTVSGSSVSFNSAFALPLKECKVSFSATESGTGEKSPSNPYTISGVSGLNLSANSVPVSVNFGDTYYGGEFDVVRKKLVVTYGIINNLHTRKWTKPSSTGSSIYTNEPLLKSEGTLLLSNIFSYSGYNTTTGVAWEMWNNQLSNIFVRMPDASWTSDDFKNYLSDKGGYIVYPLATPIEIDLSSIPDLSSIIGNNTFSTDTGTLEITFADLQEKSASGAVATFNTALAMPLSSCNIAVNAWQEGSGDPSPSNVRPIHGFSEVNATRLGKNVWGNGVGNPDVSDLYKGWRLRYSTNARMVFFDKDTSQDISGIYLGYTVTGKDATGGGVRWVINNGTVVPNNAVTSIHHYISVYPPNNSALEKLFNRFYVMVVIDNATYDTYEPYVTPTIYTIQLGQEVYGAEVDVVNGVLTVTFSIIDLGNLTWRYLTSGAGTKYFGTTLQGAKMGPNNNGNPNGLCDRYKLYGLTSINNLPNFSIEYGRAFAAGIDIAILDDRYTDETTFNNDISGTYLMYELANPFDIQLTPTQIETLIGNNTIFADTGDIDLTYKDLDIAKRGNFREVFRLPS